METKHKEGRNTATQNLKWYKGNKLYWKSLQNAFKNFQIFRNLKVNKSDPREEMKLKLINNYENYLENC